jgi:hypothetical protein
MKIKSYIFNDTTYDFLYQVSEALGKTGVFIPLSISDAGLEELGVTITYTDEPIDILKQRKLRQIDALTSSKIVGGFTSSCTGEEVTYDSDKDTQLTMQGIALNVNTELFAEKYPTGCPVRGYVGDAEHKTVQWLTPAQVLAWQADLSIHIGTCKQWGWTKQAEVAAATTEEELDNIQLS